MVRSLYSAVAGLTVHQTRMDVIGNNIANVNTYGFKASRTSFSDIYYQSKKASTGGTAVYAGNNQAAVGYGVEISSIDKDMSTSSFQSSNRVLDLAITNDGFFIVGTVNDLNKVNSVAYTRYGNFGVDSDGNLVNTLNQFVLGTENDGKFSSSEMNAKNVMYNTITTTGQVSLKSLPKEPSDSLSRNMLDAYLIGSCFKSNLITPDYHLYKTLHNRNGITRET